MSESAVRVFEERGPIGAVRGEAGRERSESGLHLPRTGTRRRPQSETLQPMTLALQYETPENVILSFRLAGPATRLLAFAIDLGIQTILSIVVTMVALATIAFVGAGAAMGLIAVCAFLIFWWYFAISEWLTSGRTMGKAALRIRVMHEYGEPIGLWAAVLRNFVRLADLIPGVALVAMLAGGNFRRLGDLMARTIVVHESPAEPPREPLILEKIPPLSRTEINGWVPPTTTLLLIEEFHSRRNVLSYERGHMMAQSLAITLADKLNYQGDRAALEKYPMGFLAKVYKTFRVPTEDEPASDQAASRSGPRAAGPDEPSLNPRRDDFGLSFDEEGNAHGA